MLNLSKLNSFKIVKNLRNVTGQNIGKQGYTIPSIRPRIATTGDVEKSKMVTVPSEIIPIKGSHQMRRAGTIGRQIGMTARWDKWGQYVQLSVIRIEENIVLDVYCESKDGFNNVVVAGGNTDIFKIKNRLLANRFKKWNVSPRYKIKGFRVTPECLLPNLTELNSQHQVPGQQVDVYGKTKGKGFQGVIKRWGMNRQTTSHGNSKTTRKQGSIGARIGKVHKGKKMPGKMGNKNRICKNIKIFAIDHKRNLLFLEGSVNGHRDGWVRIRDSIYMSWQNEQLPVPTYVKDKNVDRREQEQRDPIDYDPLENYFEGQDDDDFDN